MLAQKCTVGLQSNLRHPPDLLLYTPDRLRNGSTSSRKLFPPLTRQLSLYIGLNSRSRSSRLVIQAYNVVVTGSSKGIGKALAKEFVRSGDSVVITSRDAERVQATVEELLQFAAEQNTGSKVIGYPADVSKADSVAALADFAAQELGDVDFWINNAGSNAYSYKFIMDSDSADIANIVQTNILGVIFGCKEAIRIMRNQRKPGHVFSMDGAGADGGATPRFSTYGATKRSLEQLSKSLRSELRMAGVKDVYIHNLSPGMVTTDLLMSGADSKISRWFINCLAETPETVAENLVPRIRAVPEAMENPINKLKGGEYIRFLTKAIGYKKIIERLAFGKGKNRFVEES